jgi:leader peptidase (prepilin peptidase) / N-methyltransferase
VDREPAAVIPRIPLLGVAFAWGAIWGSFVNVVIERWLRGMSVVRPGSQCLSCGKPIAFYDNVPILSYLVLRGRCRSCGATFSARHLGVEGLLALASLALAARHLVHPAGSLVHGLAAFFVDFSLVAGLVAIAFIDLGTGYIPDAISLPGIVVGASASAILPERDPLGSIAAAVGGFLLVELVFIRLYRLLRGIQGMWPGDAKLLAMIGAFLGWKGAVFALFAGSVQGAVVGGLAARRAAATSGDGTSLGRMKVPFGPYLALGAVEFLFFGDAVLSAYRSLGAC